MAGAAVSFSESGLDEVLAGYKAMQERIRHGNRFYGRAALAMYADVIDHFKKQKDSKGKAWPLWLYPKRGDEPRERRSPRPTKRGGTKLLQDMGILRGSILFQGKEHDARVFTENITAATHNYGDPSRNIVQREYMWLSPEARARIMLSYGKFLIDGNPNL